jgi:hypothetical protein
MQVLRVSADETPGPVLGVTAAAATSASSSFETGLSGRPRHQGRYRVAWRDAKQVLEAYGEFRRRAPRESSSTRLRLAPPAPWLPKENTQTDCRSSSVTGKIEDGASALRKSGKPVADIVTRRPHCRCKPLDATQPRGAPLLSTILQASIARPLHSLRACGLYSVAHSAIIFPHEGLERALQPITRPSAIATGHARYIAGSWGSPTMTRST